VCCIGMRILMANPHKLRRQQLCSKHNINVILMHVQSNAVFYRNYCTRCRLNQIWNCTLVEIVCLLTRPTGMKYRHCKVCHVMECSGHAASNIKENGIHIVSPLNNKKCYKIKKQYFVFERNTRKPSNDLKASYIVN